MNDFRTPELAPDSQPKPTLREIAKELRKTMRCNCDLDNWEPEQSTGHSWVCRIHKTAMLRHAGSDHVGE